MSEDKRDNPNRRVDRSSHAARISGLSEQDQSLLNSEASRLGSERAKVRGEQLGQQIFGAVEDLLGGAGSFRQSHVTEAWSDAHSVWGDTHKVHADPADDDYPFVKITDPRVAGVHGRYPVNGVYMDLYSGDDESPFDTLHIDKEDRQNPKAVQERFSNWAEENPEPYWE